MKWKSEWLLVLLLVLSLAFINLFVYNAVSQYSSKLALWILFLPLGIVLLIFFLIQGLKFWLER
jgi:uncharacterized membrane protein